MERDGSPLKHEIFRWLMKLDYLRILILTLTYLSVIILILLSFSAPDPAKLKIGEVSRQTLRSEYTFFFADKFELNHLYATIESNQPFYYSFIDKNEDFFNQNLMVLMTLLHSNSVNDIRKKTEERDWHFSDSTLAFLFQNRELIARYTNRIQFLYRSLNSKYIVIDQIASSPGKDEFILLRNDIPATISRDQILVYPLDHEFTLSLIQKIYPDLGKEFRSTMADLFINLVQPTALLNSKFRIDIIRKNLDAVKNNQIIHKRDYIIQRGEIINQNNLARIMAYSDYKKKEAANKIPFYTVLSLLLYIFLIYRFYKYEQDTFTKSANVIIALLGFILVNIFYFFCTIHNEIPYLPVFLVIPFALVSISLPIVLMNDRVSIILLISYSFFYMFYPTFDIISYLNLIIISFATIYTAQVLKNRNDFFKAALIIGIIELVFSAISVYFDGLKPTVDEWGIITLFSFGNGFVSAIISSGAMPLLENGFKIPTRFRLLELTNPTTSPLLKKLKTEAPGTYNHSILLGDMCEAAAERLGIDSLLLKAGGYYHDIGKMEIPQYFIENQDGHNRHDDIRPSISVSVLKSHVKLGVESARKYRIPEEVVDYIREHHGTTAISYFFHQAVGLFGDENVNIEDYEYPGPKPSTKGTAVLMLADGIEASVRAYSQNNERFTTKIIEDIIDDIIRNRMDKGQFEECDITLHDLKIIAEEFFKFLASYYHKRIEYKK